MNIKSLCCCVALLSLSIADARQLPGRQPGGAVRMPNGWSVKSAGNVIPLDGIGIAVDVAKDGRIAVAVDNGSRVGIRVYTASGELSGGASIPDGGAGLGWLGGSKIVATGGRTGNIYVMEMHSGIPVLTDSIHIATHASQIAEGIAVSGDFLYAGIDSDLVVVSVAQWTVMARIHLDGRCRALLHSAADRIVYVTMWDAAAIVAVSLDSMRVRDRCRIGSHPCALAEDAAAHRLFVACANDDIITVVDEMSLHVTHVLATSPFSGPRGGSSPCAMSLTGNGQFLFVANSGNNAVVVFAVSDPDRMGVVGWIPTGRSPVSVAVHGKQMIAVNAFGVAKWGEELDTSELSAELRGSLSIVAMPNSNEMRQYTQTVLNNIPYFSHERVDHCEDSPVPDTGLTSALRHVFLIVKEGHTFDELFGDLEQVEGGKLLCKYPAAITPNQHSLARQFTLCDNLFADALVHEEAPQWMMAACATDATRSRWPAHRGHRGQPWVFTGQTALTSPSIGYIWDYCEWKRVRSRIYGEFTETRQDSLSFAVRGIEDSFSGLVCQTYPSYDIASNDVTRVAEWEKELEVFERRNLLPGLIIIRLAGDKRSTETDETTPEQVVDNDAALGRLVGRITVSPFWRQSAIFIVEQDGEGGRDHISGHRVPALVVSPYSRRGSVDSTMYSTSSILKTVERIVGLPSMSQYDECAPLMCIPFDAARDDSPYVPVDITIPNTGVPEEKK